MLIGIVLFTVNVSITVLIVCFAKRNLISLGRYEHIKQTLCWNYEQGHRLLLDSLIRVILADKTQRTATPVFQNFLIGCVVKTVVVQEKLFFSD